MSIRSILITMVVCFSPCAARSDVFLSEIMYNPNGEDIQAGQFNKEWVEIYNGGSEVVDLGGWTFEDIQDNDSTSAIPANTLLPPGQALVLTGDASSLDANWGPGINRLQLNNFPTLANSPSGSNEILALRDQNGVLRDQVNYDDEFSWPRDDGPYGSSIFLRPEQLGNLTNDFGNSWLPGMPGVYGSYFANGGGLGNNHGSPGIVITEVQTPFQPSPDAAWSMVVLPDTQNYTKSSQNKSLLTEMTQWISDNRDHWNIQVVLQEGDIVNNNDTENPSSGDQTGQQQWQNAKDSFSVLNGQVPYILATGNHDHGTTNAQNRSTQLNEYFRVSDNRLVDPVFGGILAGQKEFGRLENAYYEFKAPDGREMLVFSLEWGPRQETVDWANQIAGREEFAEHTAILLTHAYMYNDETRYDWARNQDSNPNNNQGGNPHSYATGGDTHDGQELWDELVKLHENFQFVFSGHVGGDGLGLLTSAGDNGNEVHQMLFNAQFETRGGNGWLRVIEFLEDGETVRVRAYTPHYDLQRTDSVNDFTLSISPLPYAPTDFNEDGSVDGLDLLAWRNAFGDSDLADANFNGETDGADFLKWQRQFQTGGTVLADSTSVPEPSCSFLVILAATTLGFGRVRV